MLFFKSTPLHSIIFSPAGLLLHIALYVMLHHYVDVVIDIHSEYQGNTS